jgi:hypothetical protein
MLYSFVPILDNNRPAEEDPGVSLLLMLCSFLDTPARRRVVYFSCAVVNFLCTLPEED